MREPKLIDIPLHVDDRGTVHCVMDRMKHTGIQRTYVVRNWSRGRIRAWHGHNRADTYMHVLSGAVKFAAKPIDSKGAWSANTKTVTITDEKPQIFFIPSGWFNGAVSLVDNTKIIVYSTLTFNSVKTDDIRDEVTDKECIEVFEVKDR